jgi:signal transduction histidine kinase
MPAERLRWRQVRSTTPFRLTVLLGALFLAGLWATLGASYVLTARELTARSDRILRARADALLAAPAAVLPARIDAEIAAAGTGISYFALIGRDGEPVTGNVALAATAPPALPFSVAASPGRHGPLRMIAVCTANGETILVGRDVSQIRDLRRRLLLILVASGVGGTVLLLVAAVGFSLGPLRRVRDLARAARAIAAGDFATRMPMSGRHDELDQFADTVNRMIDEVVHVVAQVKTATDAVAHDLRTPLTRVRASLGRVRAGGDLPPAATAVVDRAIADLDEVVGRFAALLRIAELEAEGRRAGLRPLPLAPVIAELVELWEPLAEERGVALLLGTTARCEVDADPELLMEALGNLVDNALKFARGTVSVRLVASAGEPVIEVTDDGPGIPVEEREAVLRRFHRAKGAAGVEGTGLGLAVVAAIVHLHGFRLEFADAAPGLVARVLLGPSGLNYFNSPAGVAGATSPVRHRPRTARLCSNSSGSRSAARSPSSCSRS